MELIKSIKKHRLFNIKWNKIEGFLFPFLSMCFVLMDQAFLFNPFILMMLFVSFRQDGWIFLATYFSLSFTAFLINPSYGMEIILIGLVQFFISFSFARIHFKSKYGQYYDCVLLVALISGLMLINSFSLTNLIYCLFSSIITIFITFHLSKFFKSLQNQDMTLTDINYLCVFSVFLIAATTFPVAGLILLRIFILKILNSKKTLLSVSIFFISGLILSAIYSLSINVILIVLMPCLVIFIPKKQTTLYFIFSTIFTMLLDPLFYSNGLFYQNFVALLLAMLIPNSVSSQIQTIYEDKEDERLTDFKKQTTYLMNYLNMMNFNIEENSLTPREIALLRLKAKVCYGCDHEMYCKLSSQLASLITIKLSSNDRKIITKECIKPYKLTLALQQAYQIYLSEESYYNESIRRKDMLYEIIGEMNKPLIKMRESLTNSKSIKAQILESFSKNNLLISDLYIKNSQIIIECNNGLNEEQILIIEDILFLFLKTRFSFINESKSILKYNFQYVYQEKKRHNVIVSHYSKPASKYNGDAYVIEEIHNKKVIVLCDGMGHDIAAHKISQKVISAFINLYREDGKINQHLKQINNLIRLCSVKENYSTFDFAEIDLQSLELVFYKAGAVESYIIRNKSIIKIPVGGLPLGAIDQEDYVCSSYKLQPNDVLIMVSDGFEDTIDNLDTNIFASDMNEEEIYRNIYLSALSNMKHLDDITMIVCKIL